MVDPQASRFWQAALQSGLIDVPSLTACWEAIPPEKREVAEHLDRRLARQAVQQGQLTLWQAQQLLAGRTSGFRVDRYLLLDLIGQGGMGRVYLARDTRLNRRVALKILSPERMNNPRAIARFQREARVGAQLQHENLVRIYDYGESNGQCYLVMEYIEGKTIGALIRREGPMPPADGRPAGAAGRAGAGARAPQGADPPRRQPLQHPGDPRRDRQAGRPGSGDRPGRGGAGHPRGGHGRHVRLRLARAGPALARGRHPQRHLFAGLHALSHDGRPGALSQPEPAGEALRATRRSSRRLWRNWPRMCRQGWSRWSSG